MKKFLILILLVVLALPLWACSSIDKVEGIVEEQGYVGIDMEKSTEQSAMKEAVANTVRKDYAKIKGLSFSDENAKIFVWAILPTNIMEMANPNFAIIVEFSSRGALVNELVQNAELGAIVASIVGEGDIEELVYQKGVAVDNCIIYAKGAKSSELYKTLRLNN